MAGIFILYLFVLTICSLISYKYSYKSFECKCLFYLIGIAFIFETAGLTLNIININNQKLFLIETIICLPIILHYYKLSDSIIKKYRLNVVFFLLYMICFCIIKLYSNDDTSTLSRCLIVNGIIIVFTSLISIYGLLINPRITNVIRIPHFWLTINFLFFWSVTLLYWGLRVFIHNHFPVIDIYWGIIVVILCILHYGIMAFVTYHFSDFSFHD